MIINPKKILWPTDFSPLSLKAADYACGFREIFGAELHVIHVCQPLSSDPIPALPLAAERESAAARQQTLEIADAQLRRLVGEWFTGERTIKCEALLGNPWYETCEYAKRNDVDLIIVATHGRTGLRHVLIGSVAERIVQHAPCPVLVVKDVERDFAIA